MSNALPIADLDEVIASLDGLLEESEQTFATIGAGLGDAIVTFGTLTTTFETLSSALESDELRAAADQLAEISKAVNLTGERLARERSALEELIALNRMAAAPLDGLQNSIRAMATLTCGAKIEAARIDGQGDDLSVFSFEIAQIVKAAQTTVLACRQERNELAHLLSEAGAAHAKFHAASEAKLVAIARELAATVQAVDASRRQAAVASAGIGQRSKAIGAAVGEAIVALQIGDSTRQRVEHVVSALRLLRQGLETDAPADADRGQALRCVCLLQAAQIESASRAFEDELRKIGASFGRLERDLRAIAQEGGLIHGSSDGSSRSFLGALKENLDVTARLMQACEAACADVDRASGAAIETMTALQTQLASLAAVVRDMTFVGMNAALRSRRFGAEGRGLGVVAEQLRGYAREIAADVDRLAPSLQRAVALAQGFKERASGRDDMAAFEAGLARALKIFADGATRLDAARGALLQDADHVSGFLDRSSAQLGGQAGIGAMLAESPQKLERIARSIPSEGINVESLAPLFRALWARYTMEEERRTHMGFPDLPTGADSRETVSPSTNLADLDDVLFA